MLRRVSLLALLGSYSLGEVQSQRTAVVLAAAVVTMAAERAAACTSATRKRAATFVAIDEERRQKRRRKRKKRPLVHPGPGVWDDYAPLFDAGHDSLAAPPPGCALRLAPCALRLASALRPALRLASVWGVLFNDSFRRLDRRFLQ